MKRRVWRLAGLFGAGLAVGLIAWELGRRVGVGQGMRTAVEQIEGRGLATDGGGRP